CQVDDLTPVDPVVVEHDVKQASPPITMQQRPQDVQEQPAALLVSLHPDQMPGAVTEGSGHEAFDVLSRGEDLALLTGKHPVRSNTAVQVDVHLVQVERFLLGAEMREHPSDNLQSAPTARRGPRTPDPRTGATPPGPQHSEAASDGGPTDLHTRTLL